MKLLFLAIFLTVFTSCQSDIMVQMDEVPDIVSEAIPDIIIDDVLEDKVTEKNTKDFISIPGGIEDYNKLPSISFNKMIEDDSGNRLLATPNGLAIEYANDVDTIIITINDGLESNIVNDVLVSGLSIYAATTKGLAISNNSGVTFTNFNTDDGYSHDNIKKIVHGPDNKLYLITGSSIDIINEQGNLIESWSTINGLASNTITDLIFIGSNIFVATGAGLSISTDNGISFITKTTADGLLQDSITKLEKDGGRLYLVGSSGLNFTDDNGANFTSKTSTDGINHNSLKTIEILDNGDIYTGGTWGISISNDNGVTFSDSGILNEYVYDIIPLNDGSLMITSSTNSYIYKNAEITPYLSINFGSDVRALEQDSNGRLYFLTSNGYVTSDDNGETYDLSNAYLFSGNSLAKIKVSSTGNKIYIGGTKGLHISLDGGNTFFTKDASNGLSGDSVRGLDVDNAGNIYALISNSGLNISLDEGATFVSRTTANGIAHSTVTGLVVNKATGDIYISSWGGISRSIDGGANFTTRNSTHGLGHTQSYDVTLDSVGNVYAATYGGLGKSTDFGNSFTNITTANGLAHNRVDIVRVDSNGVIYCETPYGSAFAISTDNGVTFNSIDIFTDIPSTEVIDVLKVASGRVFLASSHGFFFTDDNFSTYTAKLSFAPFEGKHISDIKFQAGKMYVTHSDGLSISEDEGSTFSNRYWENSDLEMGSVYKIQLLGGSEFIVTTSTGASYTRNDGFSFHSSGLAFSAYYAVSTDSNKNLFFASVFNGIYVGTVDNYAYVLKNSGHGLPAGGFMNDTFVDDNDILYIATSAGLSVSTDSGASFDNKVIADGLPSNYIRKLSGSPGRLLIGTDAGLAISTDAGATYSTRTTANGLESNNITCIFDDGVNLYIGTDKGVSLSTDGGNTFTLFANIANGLDSNLITAINKSPAGNIFIGTDVGLSGKRIQ